MTPRARITLLARSALLAAAGLAWSLVPPERRTRSIARVEAAWLLSDPRDQRLERLLDYMVRNAHKGLGLWRRKWRDGGRDAD